MLPKINVDKMVEFLVGLLNTPSPTGDTDRAMAYVQKAFADLPVPLAQAPKGFLVGTWPGEKADAPRGVDGPCRYVGGNGARD